MHRRLLYHFPWQVGTTYSYGLFLAKHCFKMTMRAVHTQKYQRHQIKVVSKKKSHKITTFWRTKLSSQYRKITHFSNCALFFGIFHIDHVLKTRSHHHIHRFLYGYRLRMSMSMDTDIYGQNDFHKALDFFSNFKSKVQESIIFLSMIFRIFYSK